MRFQKLGNTAMSASVVGLGTWVTGGGAWWGGDPDEGESIRAIHAAIDAGVSLIDTAPAYGFGRSEEVVGKAVKGRREKVLLATKCGLWWHDARGSEFFAIDGRTVRRSLRPDTIRAEIEHSLQRLGTDYIDLYQTHWPSVAPERTAISDTMACLVNLQDQGKIRAIGVCNVSTEELAEHLACGSVASDQFRYSMLCRGPEKDILPMCRERGLAALTYMSLEQGLLTGKVGMDRVFGGHEFRSNTDWNPWYRPENRRRVLDMLERWKDLAARYTCEMAALVVAWTLAQPGVTHVLCGARRPDQIIQTATAADLAIAPEDLQRMRCDVEALGEPA